LSRYRVCGLGSNGVFRQVDYPSCIDSIIHKMLNYGKEKAKIDVREEDRD